MPYLSGEEFDLAERVHLMIISGDFQAWRKGTPQLCAPKPRTTYPQMLIRCRHYKCWRLVVKGEATHCYRHRGEAKREAQ